MKQIAYLFFYLFFFQSICFSQSKFVVQNKKETTKIKFQLINNLVVIPVEINGVKLSFLLDTGVSKSIIFNFLNITDSLQIKNSETIFLRGLGEGDAIKALRSKKNILKVGDAININQELYAVYNPDLNFEPRLGVPLHGIIGYDLFKDLIVEINYSSKTLILTNTSAYIDKPCRKCETIDLEFYKKKPYIYSEVTINKKQIPVKLLIDSGGSDALWLFEDDSLGIQSDNLFFKDFLGHGLSGSVYGKRSKVEGFSLKHFNFKQVNVSYPEASSLAYVKQHKDRNGSLAGSILRRFNVVFNYKNNQAIFKKNKHFSKPFRYNKSGIELEQNGIRLVKQKDYDHVNNSQFLGKGENFVKETIVINTKYKLAIKPAYSIVELRKDSPAEKAGLMVGDVILSINNTSSEKLSLQELIHYFFDKDGKRIKLLVDRDDALLLFEFNLEDVFN